ncbi:hypothetical protein ACQUFY_23125 [Robbsia andropogonis]|uniref:hypothetical protein n=1 Tax=Robbsia andropogonis TaxID=28092 RepID=UPI003D202216
MESSIGRSAGFGMLCPTWLRPIFLIHIDSVILCEGSTFLMSWLMDYTTIAGCCQQALDNPLPMKIQTYRTPVKIAGVSVVDAESKHNVKSSEWEDSQQNLEGLSRHALMAVDYLNVLLERRIAEHVRNLELERLDWRQRRKTGGLR